MQRSIKVQLAKNALFICTPGWTKSLLIQGKSWSESVAPPPRGSPHRLPARHIYLRWERQPEATAVRHFGWSPKQQPRVIPPVGRLFCNLLLSCSHNISNRTLICDQSSEESSAHLLKSLSSDDQKAWEIFQKVWISKTSPKQTKIHNKPLTMCWLQCCISCLILPGSNGNSLFPQYLQHLYSTSKLPPTTAHNTQKLPLWVHLSFKGGTHTHCLCSKPPWWLCLQTWLAGLRWTGGSRTWLLQVLAWS